jgi:adenine phosphoribosyltransferase
MLDQIKEKIREIKDFPKPGIGFKDITPLLLDPVSFSHVVARIREWAQKLKPDVIVGIESRGFLFAAPLALDLGLGLSLIRKKGKLPHKTICLRAPNEYAVEYFEMHRDSISPDQRVIIIDDLIATGSSSVCAIDLVKKLKGRAVGFAAVVDLAFLSGIKKIEDAHSDVEVFSLISFED